MKNIYIRPIRAEDNVEIAAIIRKILIEFGANKPGTVYFDPTTDDLNALFSMHDSAYFIAEADGKIVGGSGVFPTPALPEGCCELVKLYLITEMRGQGLGLQSNGEMFSGRPLTSDSRKCIWRRCRSCIWPLACMKKRDLPI